MINKEENVSRSRLLVMAGCRACVVRMFKASDPNVGYAGAACLVERGLLVIKQLTVVVRGCLKGFAPPREHARGGARRCLQGNDPTVLPRSRPVGRCGIDS